MELINIIFYYTQPKLIAVIIIIFLGGLANYARDIILCALVCAQTKVHSPFSHSLNPIGRHQIRQEQRLNDLSEARGCITAISKLHYKKILNAKLILLNPLIIEERVTKIVNSFAIGRNSMGIR